MHQPLQVAARPAGRRQLSWPAKVIVANHPADDGVLSIAQCTFEPAAVDAVVTLAVADGQLHRLAASEPHLLLHVQRLEPAEVDNQLAPRGSTPSGESEPLSRRTLLKTPGRFSTNSWRSSATVYAAGSS